MGNHPELSRKPIQYSREHSALASPANTENEKQDTGKMNHRSRIYGLSSSARKEASCCDRPGTMHTHSMKLSRTFLVAVAVVIAASPLSAAGATAEAQANGSSSVEDPAITALASSGGTDTLTLTNGDHLTGSLVAIAGDSLTFKTSYAPSFTLPLTEVASLTAHGDFELRTPGGAAKLTRVRVADGEVILPKSEEAVPAAETAPDEKAVQQEDADGKQAPVSGAAAKPESKPAAAWTGQASLGYTVQAGNRDDKVGSMSFKVKRAAGKLDLLFDGKGNYATREGTRTANSLRLGAEGNFAIDGWFYYARLDGETDEFEELNVRANASGGIGRHFWRNKEGHLTGKIGASYEYEDFFGGATDHSAQARIDLDYKRKFLTRLAFGQVLALFPSPAKLANSRYESSTRLDVALDDKDRISIRMEYEQQYDGEPRPGVESLDSTLSTSIVFKF